ncbi:hypothetical protein ACFWZW_07710 [Microbacterium enclense]|uniref:hypothetical protein n=1 Tax=Microbacterium enclense TaxID=993073 RepID=UPI0036DB4828
MTTSNAPDLPREDEPETRRAWRARTGAVPRRAPVGWELFEWVSAVPTVALVVGGFGGTRRFHMTPEESWTWILAAAAISTLVCVIVALRRMTVTSMQERRAYPRLRFGSALAAAAFSPTLAWVRFEGELVPPSTSAIATCAVLVAVCGGLLVLTRRF